MKNSPLESGCVVVAHIENYSTSKPLKASPEKSQILSCDILVANERYGFPLFLQICYSKYILYSLKLCRKIKKLNWNLRTERDEEVYICTDRKRWIYRQSNIQTEGRTGGWTDGLMVRWLNGRTDGSTDGWLHRKIGDIWLKYTWLKDTWIDTL